MQNRTTHLQRLTRQRHRDTRLAVGLIIFFSIVISILVWIAYVHNIAPGNT